MLSSSRVVLTNPSAQLYHWTEHYSTLYATDDEISSDALTSLGLLQLPALLQLPVLHELDSNITLHAVECGISGLKVNKSPSADSIPPEILKSGGPTLTSELLEVLQLCWLWH